MTIFASDGSTKTADDTDPADDQSAAPPDPTTPAEPVEEPAIPAPDAADAEPDDDPLPVTGEVLPAVVDDTTPGVTTPEKWVQESEWNYDWLEFKGDRLAIRVPKGSAVQAIVNARHCSAEFQERLVFLVVSKHLSQESFDRISYRMVDPDDEQVDLTTWGDLLNALLEIGSERMKQEAEALAAVKNGKPNKGK